MTFYHCPATFRHKPYGCGYGPVNASTALLDCAGKCPTCGKELRKMRSTARKNMAAIQEHLDAAAAAAQLFGATAGTRYLAVHKPRR